MNWYFVAAAVTAALVSLGHSVVGEWLIFTKLRRGGLVPNHGGSLLESAHVRILWASWHVLTVFGLCIAAVLLNVASATGDAASATFLAEACASAALGGAVLVAIGTKGWHPGWVGLLAVTVLVCVGLIH